MHEGEQTVYSFERGRLELVGDRAEGNTSLGATLPRGQHNLYTVSY
jgi:hypothetical protein